MTNDPAVNDLIHGLHLIRRAMLQLNLTPPSKVVLRDIRDILVLREHVEAAMDYRTPPQLPRIDRLP